MNYPQISARVVQRHWGGSVVHVVQDQDPESCRTAKRKSRRGVISPRRLRLPLPTLS